MSHLLLARRARCSGSSPTESFAHAVLALAGESGNRPTSPGDLTVDECIEKAEFARVTDEFSQWFDALDLQDAIVVGEPNRLLGIVTAMDVLRYLYGVASPFVMVAEIELAIGELIRHATDEAGLAECAQTALASTYDPDPPPTELEAMTSTTTCRSSETVAIGQVQHALGRHPCIGQRGGRAIGHHAERSGRCFTEP